MKIIIIGGGASGCFAAANIHLPQAEIILLERTGKLLQKVKISGGGRCNVTHHCFEVPELLKAYPRGKNFLKKSLHHFTPQHTIDWFAKQGILLKTESDGRMFPSTNDSQTIIDALVRAMNNNGVKVRFHQQVLSISPKEGGYEVSCHGGENFWANKVIVSVGGFPKAEQFDWIKATGHTIINPVPSLFTFNLPLNNITDLMGVSVPSARVKLAGTKLEVTAPLLITHWGLSGPAILKLSALAARELAEKKYEMPFVVNWASEHTVEEAHDHLSFHRQQYGKAIVQQHPPFNLPKSLWQYLVQEAGLLPTSNFGSMTAAQQNKLAGLTCAHPFDMKGKTTFKEEFVTCGGVELPQINPQTMESKTSPGLYFVGEVLNADGITGGFNFQHAWSSGWLAAKHLSGM